MHLLTHTHMSCYASGRSLALAHTRHATLQKYPKMIKSLTHACGTICSSLCADTTRKTRQTRLWMKIYFRHFGFAAFATGLAKTL